MVEPECPVLGLLRAVRSEQRRTDMKIDRLADDMWGVKRRLSSLDGRVALLQGDYAGQSLRIDRVEARLERIERQLDLAPAG